MAKKSINPEDDPHKEVILIDGVVGYIGKLKKQDLWDCRNTDKTPLDERKKCFKDHDTMTDSDRKIVIDELKKMGLVK